MAIYNGRLDPIDAVLAVLNFEKGGGLIPTVVCDARNGRVLMVAYSNAQSLGAALREGAGIYWSRSRNELWRKGETSGNVQRLRHIAIDCDRDALLFYVDQTGDACHRPAPTCFERADFSWDDLIERIDGRAASNDGASYTRRLLRDGRLLDEKIREEAAEVTEVRSPAEAAWECADLLYFMSVKMRRVGDRNPRRDGAIGREGGGMKSYDTRLRRVEPHELAHDRSSANLPDVTAIIERVRNEGDRALEALATTFGVRPRGASR